MRVSALLVGALLATAAVALAAPTSVAATCSFDHHFTTLTCAEEAHSVCIDASCPLRTPPVCIEIGPNGEC